MGGRSSSSASTSNTSRYTDRRVAATDNARVATDGSTVYDYEYNYSTEIDNGAVDRSFEFAENLGSGLLDTLQEWGQTFKEVTGNASNAINATANRAFDFVEEARKDADERKLQKALPWLVLGVVAVAMVNK